MMMLYKARRSWQIGYHLLGLLITLLFTLPLIWLVLASLRQPGLPPPYAGEWWPQSIWWSNYSRIFELMPLGLYLLNSVVVTGSAVVLTVVVASWAGFAMAQLPQPIRYLLLGLALVLRMVPVTSLWLPRFLMLKELHLIDQLAALLLPVWFGSSPLFVLVFYWSFRRMPVALIEAARLDGFGPLAIWWRVSLPLAQPATVAVAVLTFVQYWSDFIHPLIYLKSESRYTLAVGLRMLQQLDVTNWPLLLAGVVVMVAPILVLFIGLQWAFWMEDRIGGVYGN